MDLDEKRWRMCGGAEPGEGELVVSRYPKFEWVRGCYKQGFIVEIGEEVIRGDYKGLLGWVRKAHAVLEERFHCRWDVATQDDRWGDRVRVRFRCFRKAGDEPLEGIPVVPENCLHPVEPLPDYLPPVFPERFVVFTVREED